MIKTWNQYCNQILTTDTKLAEFIASSGLSSIQLKKLQKFTKEWNELKKLAESFDQFLAPLDPIEIESPFDQEDFRYIWKTWKEYLREQHGTFIRSRMELMGLQYLEKISEGNADLAIDYLRFAMATGYPRFFKPSEKQKSTPEKIDKDGSNW